MTVRDEYNKMKSCFRIWNKNSNYDETKYMMFLEHCTKRAQTMLFKMLNSDVKTVEFDFRIGIITNEEYLHKSKVLEDCRRSIENMNII